ncbi:hypothetical protein [Brachybacterium sp. GCM10030252]|uniref:hypothetical protein n=1 Tax=Brachybacterium sp. GCM10030252 TaxID=3273380 RepID=UPI003618C998
MRRLGFRSSSRRHRGGSGPRRTSVLGIPVQLILVAMVIAALLGALLAAALEQSTASRTHSGSSAVDAPTGAGKNSSGLPVITETTLGTEVQRLVDAGMIQPPTSFDATECLREQGIQDSILIMEEVAWGTDETHGWLLVHGPMDRETLRANGGTVSATVVLPNCGSADRGDVDPQQSRLWSGSVMIGSL